MPICGRACTPPRRVCTLTRSSRSGAVGPRAVTRFMLPLDDAVDAHAHRSEELLHLLGVLGRDNGWHESGLCVLVQLVAHASRRLEVGRGLTAHGEQLRANVSDVVRVHPRFDEARLERHHPPKLVQEAGRRSRLVGAGPSVVWRRVRRGHHHFEARLPKSGEGTLKG
eukprot:scaffold14619_cov66-Phaeocystis_antarctica.AAC.7